MNARIAVCYEFASKLQPYAHAVRMGGLEPVPTHPDGAVQSLAGVAGLVLTGGVDVDPGLYGQSRDPATQEPNRKRDDFEQRLLREALAHDLPVLAICRGIQLLNVTLPGGTLIQDLPDRQHKLTPPEKHWVEIGEGSLLRRVIGSSSHAVNSRHHQAVGEIGRGLQVTALSTDGVVEALELPGHRFVLGVQWHPEDLVEESGPDLALFEELAAAVGGPP